MNTDKNQQEVNNENIRYVMVAPENIQQNVANDEIDLRELWRVMWRGKWVIILVTTLFSSLAVFYALNSPNVYKSEALLTPANTEQQGGLSALSGQFGGLASLAGINLNKGGGDKTSLAIQVLNSREFLGDFIVKHEILPDLMAAVGWDPQNNKVLYDLTRYDVKKNTWLGQNEMGKNSKPSIQKAYRAINSLLGVTVNKETGLISISFEHFSPFVAQQWVEWMVRDINEVMKKRDKDEAERSIVYLQSQIENTKIVEHRALLFQLIEEHAKTLMFANVRNEYVFKTIDSAIVPEEKIKPKRAMIVIFGCLLGSLLSIFILMIRHFYLKKS